MSKGCVNLWWHQRLTAVFLIPLLIYFVFFAKAMVGRSAAEIITIIKYPWILVPGIFLLGISYYHSVIGMQTIIEDYIKNLYLRRMLITVVKAFSAFTVVSGIVALLLLI